MESPIVSSCTLYYMKMRVCHDIKTQKFNAAGRSVYGKQEKIESRKNKHWMNDTNIYGQEDEEVCS